MKIACIGNMNNNFNVLVKLLRRRGYDAELLTLPTEPAHFHPSADTFGREYQRYTKVVEWGHPFEILATDSRQVHRELSEYDALVGCGPVPAFVNKCGKRLDLLVPYGEDYLTLPFFRVTRRPQHLLPNTIFAFHQRMGIRRSRHILMDRTSDEQESRFARLGKVGPRYYCNCPMVDHTEFNPRVIDRCYGRSAWYPRFADIRERHELVLFHHSRHIWKKPKDGLTFKGNHKLFIGFAAFLRSYPGIKSVIVTCEYGQEVHETKRLIRELGIEQHVVWLPVVPRRELLVGISTADIVVGELEQSFFSYGVVIEAMALAKPIIHHRNDAAYRATHPDLYPMFDAHTPGMVAEHLAAWRNAPRAFQEVGQRAHQWYVQNMIEKPLAIVERVLGLQDQVSQIAA